MNLHAIASTVIGRVSPFQPVVIKKYQGNTVDDEGKVVMTYTDITTQAQVQPLSTQEVQNDNLFRNRIVYDFYLNGDWSTLTRTTKNGGDMIEWNGSLWNIDRVDEGWKHCGWTKVTATQQLEEI